MMHSILNALDKRFNVPTASAHCDIPCGIYDPSTAQVAALSVIRLLDLIAEMPADGSLNLGQQAKLSRLVREKEISAAKVKDEIRIIWGDFLKQPQFDEYPDCHTLVHNIMLAGGACKQHVDVENGHKLMALVNEFAEVFWKVKGVKTYKATCPYAPAVETVYPKLD